MSFRDAVKLKIGAECFARIEQEANREVTLALQMPLKDKYDTKQFYQPRLLLAEFQGDYGRFESAGLKILPGDIADVLFRCKLLRAVKNENEYQQRSGHSGIFGNRSVSPNWGDRTTPLDDVENNYVSVLEHDIQERTLLTHISSFNTSPAEVAQQQGFFEDLFAALVLPFVSFLDGEHLTEKHKQIEPGLRSYDPVATKRFFSAPSLGYTVSGSRNYCLWHGTAWLRTFLNMLRIAGFIHPGQKEFTLGPQMEPPTYPVFLGLHAEGSYQWTEDKKESWQKFPDGCLFRSFGFRGLSNMWLDHRNFAGIKKFMLDHKQIFRNLKHPWNETNINDVAPILDVLSSATQIPDLGAKILLIHCCLEHLFVPGNTGAENKKYIIGGLKALRPQLSTWFESLYHERCEYAHKGFVLRTDGTLALITDSIRNVMSILVAKLSVS